MIKEIRMKTIKENGLNELKGYKELKNYEQFIYVNSYEWFAIKVNNEYAILLNGCGKFIIAKAFKNCLSIGARYVIEYDSFDKAESAIKKGEYEFQQER